MIAIGSDHGGFELKAQVAEYLKNKDYEIKDFGTYNRDSVDYPKYSLAVAKAVKNGECEKGIIFCGTGLGISIAANKVPGIRVALCTDSFMARLSREHNDANVLALGGRMLGIEPALDIVDTWLKTEFIGGRHKRRIDKITEIENKYLK